MFPRKSYNPLNFRHISSASSSDKCVSVTPQSDEGAEPRLSFDSVSERDCVIDPDKNLGQVDGKQFWIKDH